MEAKNSYKALLDPKEYFKNPKPEIFQKLGGTINWERAVGWTKSLSHVKIFVSAANEALWHKF